jgi:hypothetical protein
MSRALEHIVSHSYKFTVDPAVGIHFTPTRPIFFSTIKAFISLQHHLGIIGLSVLIANDEEGYTSPVDRAKSMYIFLGNVLGQMLTDSMRCRPNDIN